MVKYRFTCNMARQALSKAGARTGCVGAAVGGATGTASIQRNAAQSARPLAGPLSHLPKRALSKLAHDFEARRKVLPNLEHIVPVLVIVSAHNADWWRGQNGGRVAGSGTRQ